MLASMLFRVSASAMAAFKLFLLLTVAWLGAVTTAAAAEAYARVPTPPGIRVEQTLLDGPVFADAKGRTLYTWRTEAPGNARVDTCDFTKVRRTAVRGLGEVILPEAVPCAEMWQALWAPADAKPVGDWSLTPRANGARQWAYKGYPVYTFYLDKAPGEVKGGTNRIPQYNWSTRARETYRMPASPPADVPPGFQVVSIYMGRQLLVGDQRTLYVHDAKADGAKSCTAECALNWEPVVAPMFAESRGEWSTVEIGAGVRQWAYRGQPLFTYKPDNRRRSLDGEEVPGWKAVFVQRAPSPPSGFMVQDTSLGPSLADRQGKTIYVFACFDPSPLDLTCDTPDNTQAYRLAVCGRGDPELCRATWPYVLASEKDRTQNWVWSVMNINPQTGHVAKRGEPSLRVWAYRGRPIYTFSRDKVAGDIYGDAAGQLNGGGPGFEKIAIRSDIYPNYGED